MVTFNKINIFVEDLAEGIHDLDTDTLEVALLTEAEKPVVTDTILANLTPINYANIVEARTLTLSSSAQDPAGTYKIKITDKVFTASGGAVATFRHVCIFNQGTAGKVDPLIMWYDHGSDVTLADGETFTIDFDDTNGWFTLV